MHSATEPQADCGTDRAAAGNPGPARQLRRHPGAARHQPDVLPRRGRHADRRERRGQEHHAARDLAAGQPAQRRRSSTTGRDITRLRARRGRAPGHRAVPGGPARAGPPDVLRQPASWAPIPARDRAAIGADIEQQFAALPAPGRAPQPAGRHAQRRRAADAGDRPRPDEPPAAAAARRAEPRPGPADRARDLRRSSATCTPRA